MRLAYAIAFLTVGCTAARDHVGHWEYKDHREFTRVELQRDGTCTMLMGGKVHGEVWEGIRGRCRYTHENRTVSITEIGDFKGDKPMERMLEPLILEYASSDDSIQFTGRRPMRMVRISDR
jgi:hypothetical protein